MAQVKTLKIEGVGGSAVFSNDGRHRYLLERRLADDGDDAVLFVMLNPSLAGAHDDDPTIRKCKGFAKRWAFSRLLVVNLFSLITPYPIELAREIDPNGPEADEAIAAAAAEADRIVCAWGNPPSKKLGAAARTADLWPLLNSPEKPAWCLGRTASGTPRHPSRIPYATKLERFE